MPWRKYKEKKGKYGSYYNIAKGITVRCDQRNQWTIFINKGGERKNKTIGKGRENLSRAIKAAEVIVKSLTIEAENKGKEKANSSLPYFTDFSSKWLEINSIRWSKYTLERYEGLLRIHICPHEAFKNKRVDEIARKDIRHFLHGLLITHSSSTVELAQIVIHGIFQELIEDEVLEKNPASATLKRILPEPEQRYKSPPDPFSITERDTFLEVAEESCNWAELLMLKVMIFSGLRLGELLALRLSNIKFENSTYFVRESFKRESFDPSKKGKKRLVDIPSFLLDELQRYITHLKETSLKNGHGGKIDLLFVDPNKNGSSPYSQSQVQKLVAKVCKAANLKRRHPHDLRHTYATILLMSHLSIAYVQKQLGHSSIKITVDTYGHWIPGEGRKGLEEALNPVQNEVKKCI